MVYLPTEIKNLIINMSYKLLYEDVLNELMIYKPINCDFYYPFKRMIIYNINTLIFIDETEEDLQEVIFEDDLEIDYL